QQVTRSASGRLILRSAGGALLLFEAYNWYLQSKRANYVWGEYILEDGYGAFVLKYRKSSHLSSMKYYKYYLSGDYRGETIDISAAEYGELKAEAEALWGTTDRRGNFVPGLLQPRLRQLGRDRADRPARAHPRPRASMNHRRTR
ncbi:MAG: hypothetical protein AAGC55_32010, partial [Myxococcota bacterium]